MEIATRSADASGQSPINKLGLINLESDGPRDNCQTRAAQSRVLQIWGKEKEKTLLRSTEALNGWKENTNSAPLTSAAGCLEFGAGKKTSFQVWGQEKDVFLPRSWVSTPGGGTCNAWKIQ